MIKLSNTFIRIDKFKGWEGRKTDTLTVKSTRSSSKGPKLGSLCTFNPGFRPIHIISAPQKAQTGGSLELVAASPARKARTPGLGQILPLKNKNTVTVPVTFFWPPHVCSGIHTHIHTDIHISTTPLVVCGYPKTMRTIFPQKPT